MMPFAIIFLSMAPKDSCKDHIPVATKLEIKESQTLTPLEVALRIACIIQDDLMLHDSLQFSDSSPHPKPFLRSFPVRSLRSTPTVPLAISLARLSPALISSEQE